MTYKNFVIFLRNENIEGSDTQRCKLKSHTKQYIPEQDFWPLVPMRGTVASHRMSCPWCAPVRSSRTWPVLCRWCYFLLSRSDKWISVSDPGPLAPQSEKNVIKIKLNAFSHWFNSVQLNDGSTVQPATHVNTYADQLNQSSHEPCKDGWIAKVSNTTEAGRN